MILSLLRCILSAPMCSHRCVSSGQDLGEIKLLPSLQPRDNVCEDCWTPVPQERHLSSYVFFYNLGADRAIALVIIMIAGEESPDITGQGAG